MEIARSGRLPQPEILFHSLQREYENELPHLPAEQRLIVLELYLQLLRELHAEGLILPLRQPLYLRVVQSLAPLQPWRLPWGWWLGGGLGPLPPLRLCLQDWVRLLHWLTAAASPFAGEAPGLLAERGKGFAKRKQAALELWGTAPTLSSLEDGAFHVTLSTVLLRLDAAVLAEPETLASLGAIYCALLASGGLDRHPAEEEALWGLCEAVAP